MNLKIKPLHPHFVKPRYASAGAAAFDLHAVERGQAWPGEIAKVPLGLAVEVPEGHAPGAETAWLIEYSTRGATPRYWTGAVVKDYRHEREYVVLQETIDANRAVRFATKDLAMAALQSFHGSGAIRLSGMFEAVEHMWPAVVQAPAVKDERPTKPGWYVVLPPDFDAPTVRAFGKDGQWWIPLGKGNGEDGWMTGREYQNWVGPIADIEDRQPFLPETAPAAPEHDLSTAPLTILHKHFLSWAEKEGLQLDRTTFPDMVAYVNPTTRAAWKAVQALATPSPAVADGAEAWGYINERGEPVKFADAQQHKRDESYLRMAGLPVLYAVASKPPVQGTGDANG